MRRVRAWRFCQRAERGAGLVEAVVVVPVLLIVVFGAVEFGVAYNQNIQIHDASRKVARDVATSNRITCTDTDFDVWFDCVAAASTDVRPIAISADFETNQPSAGEEVTICVEHPLSGTMPLMGSVIDGRDLVSRTTMRIEALQFTGNVRDASFTSGTSLDECR